MGKIVAAMSMSHAPGLLSLPDYPPKEQVDRIREATNKMRDELEQAKPDLIIAFLDDHFENFFRTCIPTFCIGIGDEAYGPMEMHLDWLKIDKQKKIKSHKQYALDIFNAAQEAGIELSRTFKWEYGQNLIAPLEYIRPEYDIPVVPIYINVFTPPLATTKRVYELGQLVRRVIEKRPENVALLATGGLSHWPPYWQEDSPDDEMMRRMLKYQTEGLPYLKEDPNLWVDFGIYEEEMFRNGLTVVNPEWDQEVLAAFARGDADYFKRMTYEDMKKGGGHGAAEILNWIAVMGATDGAKCNVLLYESVPEWICGMAFVTYEEALK